MVSVRPRTWFDSEKWCKDNGMDGLVELRTKEDNDRLGLIEASKLLKMSYSIKF